MIIERFGSNKKGVWRHPSLLHAFIPSLTYSFLVHSIFHLFFHLFLHSFVHWMIHSSIPSLTQWFIHSFIHSFIYSFIHLFIHSGFIRRIRVSQPQSLFRQKPRRRGTTSSKVRLTFECIRKCERQYTEWNRQTDRYRIDNQTDGSPGFEWSDGACQNKRKRSKK